MIPFASFLMSPQSFVGALFVAKAAYTNLSPTPTLGSLGAASGDIILAINFPSGTPSTGSGSAWNPIMPMDTTVGMYWKVLLPGDIGQPCSVASSGGSGWIQIYRGASILSIVRNSSGGSGTYSGFTPSSKHQGVILATFGTGDYASVTSPASFSPRGQVAHDSQFYTGQINDRLSPPNPKYAGQSFTFSGPMTSYIIIEMLSS